MILLLGSTIVQKPGEGVVLARDEASAECSFLTVFQFHISDVSFVVIYRHILRVDEGLYMEGC